VAFGASLLYESMELDRNWIRNDAVWSIYCTINGTEVIAKIMINGLTGSEELIGIRPNPNTQMNNGLDQRPTS